MTSAMTTDDDTGHDLTKTTTAVTTVRWLVSWCFEPSALNHTIG